MREIEESIGEIKAQHLTHSVNAPNVETLKSGHQLPYTHNNTPSKPTGC